MLRLLLLHCFRSHECRRARALGIRERWVLSILCFARWALAGMKRGAAVAAAAVVVAVAAVAAVAGLVVGTAVDVEIGVDGGSMVVDAVAAVGVGWTAEERTPGSNAVPVASAGMNPGMAVAAFHNYC